MWLLLGVAWGALAGVAVIAVGSSALLRRRVGVVVQRIRTTVATGAGRAAHAPIARPFVAVTRDVARRRRDVRARRAIDRELALAVDLLAVAVGAGATPLLALDLAATWSPPAVGQSFGAIVRRVRVGTSLPDALAVEARRVPTLRPLTEALTPAIRLGSPLGPTLARIASDARGAHARRAAARARTIPVRLIFPLVLLVLPAFALLTVVPALVAGWRGI
jgi:Flp pilus assembly protein TadB